jgi:hypothetical protein
MGPGADLMEGISPQGDHEFGDGVDGEGREIEDGEDGQNENCWMSFIIIAGLAGLWYRKSLAVSPTLNPRPLLKALALSGRQHDDLCPRP